MSLLKKFKKVIAVMTIAIMSVVALPIGSFAEAAAPTVAIEQIGPSDGQWVYQSYIFKYKLVFTGDLSGFKVPVDSQITLGGGFTVSDIVFSKGEVYNNSRKEIIVSLVGVSGVGSGKYIKYAGVTSSKFTIKPIDTVKPVLLVGNPTPNKVKVGETVTLSLVATDDVGVKNINVYSALIKLNGFTAEKTVSINGNNITVTLKNIQGDAGQKSVYFSAGSVTDDCANFSDGVTSKEFTLQTNNQPEPEDPEKEEPEHNNNNNNSPVINNNITINIGRPADWVENPYTGL